MSIDSAATRRSLRQSLREARRALPASERIRAADALATRLLELPFAPATGYVAGYWAMDGEIALHAWQLRLPSGCVYCLPVLGDDATLRFAPWRSGDPLVSNRYGIPEPDITPGSLLTAADMAMIVVPLVGFDARGHRLGMGGGWYDRSLAFRHAGAAPPYLAGAAFDLQQLPAIAAEPWDVRLDAICTGTATHLTMETP
jgi:5-formyltetrahydrofolate cyclo-ligase